MGARTKVASRFFFLLGFVCCATFARAQDLPPVVPITGTLLELESFEGSVSGVTVDYAIYLPPGYAPDSERYPVIYHLHGFSARVTTHEFDPQIPPQFRCPETSCHILPAVDAAIVSGQLPPLIMVFPKMGVGELWVESLTGDRQTESKLIGDLIPHIESNYSTIPDRRFRLLQGWSQGGWGASIYGLKYPDLLVTSQVLVYKAGTR